MSDVTDIDAFLQREGFSTPDARARARALLEEVRLTRPGKRGIATAKLDAARSALGSQFVRVCGSEECGVIALASAPLGSRPLTVPPASCSVCGGSNNRRAATAMAAKLREQRIDRLLIVGGTPALHAELEQLLSPHQVKLRFVDGSTGSHSARDALPDMNWAQVAVIWGASPLPHKVSRLYTDDPPPHLRVVKFARRGIEAMCREVMRSFA